MKKAAKGIARKSPAKKPAPSKKPQSSAPSIADLMSVFETGMRQMMQVVASNQRQPEPSEPQLPAGRPPMDLDPQGITLKNGYGEVGMNTETQNSDWTRETMMAKIGTLEARMDVVTQAINVMRTEMATLMSRRR